MTFTLSVRKILLEITNIGFVTSQSLLGNLQNSCGNSYFNGFSFFFPANHLPFIISTFTYPSDLVLDIKINKIEIKKSFKMQIKYVVSTYI